jgi:hypothetical protein
MGAALWLCTGAVMAQPQSPAPSELRVSGFGTVGVAHVDAPEGWAYKRDATQADNASTWRADLDTRIGLQLNYAPVRQLELVAQAVLSRRAAVAPASDAIEWAFAAWRPDADWTLRGGRVNLDAFLLSDHRNVGFAYPFARPPVDFYAQLPTSLDGADITRVWNDQGTQWRAKVFAGRAFVFADTNTRLELPRLVGAMASREAAGLLIRASAIRYRFADELAGIQELRDALGQLTALPLPEVAAQAADLQSRLTVKDVSLTYLSLGARYEGSSWLASAEVTRLTGQSSLAYSVGYASVGRRFGALTPFATVSRASSNSAAVATPNWGAALTPVLGPAAAGQAQFLANTAAAAVNSVRIAQDTWSLGARYDLNARWALKAQWDRIRVEPNGSRLWGGVTTLDPARARVGSVVVDFVF